MELKPNPTCRNSHCVAAQAEYKSTMAEKPNTSTTTAAASSTAVLHDDNEWGIVVEESSGVGPEIASPATGLEYQYDPQEPSTSVTEPAPSAQLPTSANADSPSVDALAAMLKSLQTS